MFRATAPQQARRARIRCRTARKCPNAGHRAHRGTLAGRSPAVAPIWYVRRQRPDDGTIDRCPSPSSTAARSTGWTRPQVTVEVHLANGLPSFTLVGLADTEVKEARERVRAALPNSGLDFPAQQAHHGQPGAGRPAEGVGPLRPADRARHPGRQRADRCRRASTRLEFAGELSLAGELRPVRGALAMALALRRHGASTRARAGAARMRARARRRSSAARRSRGAAHLLDVVRALTAWRQRRCGAVAAGARPRRSARRPDAPDLRDVKGQSGAKRALEIAAAGGHSVADGRAARHRQVDAGAAPVRLLPPIDDDEALESAAVLSLTGAFSMQRWGAARGARAAPHRVVGRAGRRRLAAAARRDLAGAPRRAVPRRAARVPARGARGAARAARDRPHHDLARRAPGRLPGRASSSSRR